MYSIVYSARWVSMGLNLCLEYTLLLPWPFFQYFNLSTSLICQWISIDCAETQYGKSPIKIYIISMVLKDHDYINIFFCGPKSWNLEKIKKKLNVLITFLSLKLSVTGSKKYLILRIQIFPRMNSIFHTKFFYLHFLKAYQ